MSQEARVVSMNTEGKNMLIAYLLWWFLGWAGIHRFYLGLGGSGLTQLLLFILGWITAVVVVGFVLLAIWGIWWLLDAYFVQKHVIAYNQQHGLDSSSIRFYTSSNNTNLDQLEKLHALFEKGALTRQEYEEKKKKLL